LSTITKRDLAKLISTDNQSTREQALEIVDSVFATMRETLIEGNRVEIRGFGTLETKATKPKPAARNPRTGEIIYVPARRKTHFKPGTELKKALHEPLSTD